MQEVYILSGARTPVGMLQGSLSDVSAIELGVVAAQGAIERSGVDPQLVDQVVLGNVIQSSKDAIYFARHVALKAGLPIETPALTVNRLCGSGFEAVVQGAQQILLGESQAVLCGGGESMSQAPHVLRPAARPVGAARGPAVGITEGSVLRLLDGRDRGEPGREVRAVTQRR